MRVMLGILPIVSPKVCTCICVHNIGTDLATYVVWKSNLAFSYFLALAKTTTVLASAKNIIVNGRFPNDNTLRSCMFVCDDICRETLPFTTPWPTPSSRWWPFYSRSSAAIPTSPTRSAPNELIGRGSLIHVYGPRAYTCTTHGFTLETY